MESTYGDVLEMLGEERCPTRIYWFIKDTCKGVRVSVRTSGDFPVNIVDYAQYLH